MKLNTYHDAKKACEMWENEYCGQSQQKLWESIVAEIDEQREKDIVLLCRFVDIINEQFMEVESKFMDAAKRLSTNSVETGNKLGD